MLMPAVLLLAWAACQFTIEDPAQQVLPADPATAYLAGPWRALGPVRQMGAPSARSESAAEKFLREMAPGAPWPGLEAVFEGADGNPAAWEEIALEASVRARETGLIHPRERVGLETGRVEPREALPRAYAADPDGSLASLFYRTMHAREKVRIPVLAAAAGGLRLWCNGTLVAEIEPGQAPVRGVLELEPGLNHLLFKSASAGGDWWFEMRHAHALTQRRINRAIDDGLVYLMQRQLPDGSWQDYPDYGSGCTALAAYTLLKSGVPADHAAVRRGLAYLRAHPARQTYSLALMLLAVGAAGDDADLTWMEEMAGDLVYWQEPSGMWGYPNGGDLSNTQYAGLGLWAAAKRGIEIPEKTWMDLAQAVLECLDKDGERRGPASGERTQGFGYTQDTHGATASMTAAGIGTLAICLEHLPPEGSRLAARARTAITAGSEWLGRNCPLHPMHGDAEMWGMYLLYGLERAGALCGRERFGEHPWYPEGAEWLLERQRPTGGWGGTTADVNSCFALLFLARATSKSAVTPRGAAPDAGRLLRTSLDDGPLILRIALGTPADLWIDAGSRDFARIARVVYWIRSPDDKWTTIEGGGTKRFDARFDFSTAGRWEVRASAFRHDGASFGSGTLEFGQERGATRPAAARQAEAGEENLLRAADPEARASSGPAQLACDLQYATRWMCSEDDAAPWLEIVCTRRTEARRLALCPAPWQPQDSERRVTPARVAVRVNGEGPRLVDIPEGLPERVILDLGESVVLRSVRVEILALHGGRLGAVAAGFSEIEAYASRE